MTRLVTLLAENQLSLELGGPPRSHLTLQITGADSVPPVITAIVTPTPNEAGWNNTDVTVSFACQDATSGIESCPEPVTLTSGGAGQPVNGIARDRAGNTAEASVTINIDKTPPTVDLTWPPEQEFGTDLATVEIEGSVSDELSGVESAFLGADGGSEDPDKEPLSIPNFLVEKPLNTQIPPGEVHVDNPFEISVFDEAGNRAAVSFLVAFTTAPTTIGIDPDRTEERDGIEQAIDRLFVSFAEGVDRDRMEAVIGAHGGRVGGIFPTVSAVLAVFRTDSLAELDEVAAELSSEPDVVEVAPASYVSTSQAPPFMFDNALLAANNRAAYDNVRAVGGMQLIRDRGVQLRATNVAIIDTGLNPNYGAMNELGAIQFFDLCTMAGQRGTPSPAMDTGVQVLPGMDGIVGTPDDVRQPYSHGAQVSGIIAGANNGQGNNGLTVGVGGAFTVSLFRTDCGAGLQDPLIFNAMELIAGGRTGRFYDVVNMSFGTKDPRDPMTQLCVNPGPDGMFGTMDDLPWTGLTRRQFEPFSRIYGTYFRKVTSTLWVMSAGNCGPGQDGIIGTADDFILTCDNILPASLACLHPNAMAVSGHNPAVVPETNLFNAGPGAVLTAPGNVFTADDPTLRAAYGFASGTSFAAPMVSGTAALIHAINPQLVGTSIRTHLLQTGRVVAGLTSPALDLQAAITALVQPPLPPPLNFFEFSSDGHRFRNFATFAVPQGTWARRPGLTGFFFDFDPNSEEDNHLEEIGVQLEQNGGRVIYRDENPSNARHDQFQFSVSGRDLPAGTGYGTTPLIPSRGGQAFVRIQETNPNIVLTGFRFRYRNGDHHMDRILIRLVTKIVGGSFAVPEGFIVEFNDKNDDDPFEVEIGYAVLPGGVVLDRGTLQGRGTGGVARVDTVPERLYIQGFLLDYVSQDHHVDEIGVKFEPRANGALSVWYNDKNDDDGFNWEVDFVALR